MTASSDETPTRGRPSSVTPDVEERVLALLSEGMSLREIGQIEGMPDRSTILRLANRDPVFAARYAEAKKQGCDALFDDALEGALNATPATAQVERLKWDARRFHIAKLHPKKYGDKVITEHTGADGGAIALQAVAPMVHPQVAAGVRALLTQAETAAGLPPNDGADDATRLRAIMASDAPLHPDLYESLYQPEEK